MSVCLINSIGVFESGLEDECLELVVIDESVLFDRHLIVEALDDGAVGDAQIVAQLGVAKFGAGLHHIIFGNLSLLLKVKMLKQSLHLLKEATVHENCTDTAKKLIKVDIFLLSFVKQGQDALQNLRWVLQAQHFRNFDKIEAFDA